MEKRLIAIGNGFGLLIDKPLRRALDIGPDTLLRVTTDGVRLVVEPCGEGDAPRKVRKKLAPWDHPRWVTFTGREDSDERRLEYFAVDVVNALERTDMSTAQFMALNHRVMPWDFYEPTIRNGLVSDEDRVDMRRLRFCLEQLESGVPLDEAVERALIAIPMTKLKLLSGHSSWCRGDTCPCKKALIS